MPNSLLETVNPLPVVGEAGTFTGTYLLHWEIGGFEMRCQDASGNVTLQICQLAYDDETARPLFAHWDGVRPANFRSLPMTRFDVRFRGRVLEHGHFGHFGRATWRIQVEQFVEVTEPLALPLPHLSQRTTSVLHDLTDWLFAIPEGKRSAWEIIKWWEVRRWAYNAIILGIGLVSFLLFLFFISKSGVLKDGEDAAEPMGVIAAPFVMNFAYTAGPFVELIVNTVLPRGSGRLGPILLKIGFAFSLFVVLLPSVCWGVFYLISLLRPVPHP